MLEMRDEKAIGDLENKKIYNDISLSLPVMTLNANGLN